MCTSIVEIRNAEGAARSQHGWFRLSHSVVSYDHPQHALLEEAVTLDFVNYSQGAEARAAVELTLESARALQAALAKVIAEAEAEELERLAYASAAHPHTSAAAGPEEAAPNEVAAA